MLNNSPSIGNIRDLKGEASCMRGLPCSRQSSAARITSRYRPISWSHRDVPRSADKTNPTAASAPRVVTPDLRRPTTAEAPTERSVSIRGRLGRRGVMTSASARKWNSGESTPMTVKLLPSRSRDSPTTRRSGANRSFHRRSLIRTTGAAFSWSSDVAKSRPTAGLTPRVFKNPEDALMPIRCWALPGAVRSEL